MFGTCFIMQYILISFAIISLKMKEVKVGWSKPPPVLTSGFNRLKPPRSICKKWSILVNTGQYESEWSIEISMRRFCGGLRYLYRFMFYLLKKEKKYCFVPAKGIFHGEITISRP